MAPLKVRIMVIGQNDQPSRRKRAVKVSLDSALVEEARAHGVNLSQFLEACLRAGLQERREQAWREENRDAIREYNKVVASRGSFSDRFRRI